MLRETKFEVYVGSSKELLLVTATYKRKNKMFKLSGNKRTEMVRGRNLKDPEMFPVSLILPDLNLKLEITYDIIIN